ncbi:MAG: hypothetical protein ACRDKI_07525 [Solirubrobacterales bacterium]
MRDIQISKPVLLALVAAILVGGFMVMRAGQSDEVVTPTATPTPAPTAATGATGSTKKHKGKKHKTAVAVAPTGATGASGGTGATGASGSTGNHKMTKAERKAALKEAAKAAGMPVAVFEAKKAGKEVIVFFWEPKAKDDQRTNDAVLNVEKYRGSHLVVFRDKISNASNYDGIAQAGQLTQTPSMVIIYKNKGDTAQGYYDAAAINQKIQRLSHYTPK